MEGTTTVLEPFVHNVEKGVGCPGPERESRWPRAGAAVTDDEETGEWNVPQRSTVLLPLHHPGIGGWYEDEKRDVGKGVKPLSRRGSFQRNSWGGRMCMVVVVPSDFIYLTNIGNREWGGQCVSKVIYGRGLSKIAVRTQSNKVRSPEPRSPSTKRSEESTKDHSLVHLLCQPHPPPRLKMRITGREGWPIMPWLLMASVS